jgi:hypothetical protein
MMQQDGNKKRRPPQVFGEAQVQSIGEPLWHSGKMVNLRK